MIVVFQKSTATCSVYITMVPGPHSKPRIPAPGIQTLPQLVTPLKGHLIFTTAHLFADAVSAPLKGLVTTILGWALRDAPIYYRFDLGFRDTPVYYRFRAIAHVYCRLHVSLRVTPVYYRLDLGLRCNVCSSHAKQYRLSFSFFI